MSCFTKIVLASSDPEKGVLVRVQGVPCYGGSFYSVLVLRYMGSAVNCPAAEVPLF